MPKVYLAGPILGQSYKDAVNWREYARRHLASYGVKALSPMRGKTYLDKEEEIRDEYTQIMSTSKGITSRDRFDVMSSDLVLAYLEGATRISVGTMIEFGWADAFRKPIVAVVGDLHDHAMVRELVSFPAKDIGEALLVVTRILDVD